MTCRHGLFVSFEGGEGAGKTTQISKLADALKQRGYDVITTREPGGTPEGDKIRNLFVNVEGGNWTAHAEVLLLFAARNIHVRDVILPALAANKIVLCDRFTDSTRVYQCAGKGLPREEVEQVKAFSIGSLEPDLTLILDLPVETGLSRAKSRIADATASGKAAEDRFEQEALDFHERLRHGYQELVADHPERCILIDADRAAEAIHADILDRVVAAFEDKAA
jgi:dTMP kinase